ncbi:AfsR/SARP family transcriptional regulator [Micromonospora sp. WMMD729]|uniref:AfsR/SARP family transcriptional regulator n=1 Tax=Micromonospora sp. WMMD729 TaxID=3404127 RepID=UPI003BF4E71E
MADLDAVRPSPAESHGPARSTATLAPQRTTVRLFGRTAVWRNGAEVPLGPAGQRTLFAVLALNADRPVPRQELLDVLWSDSQPREAVNVIQTYVKRLRRSLEPERPPRAPSGLLVRVGDGYALRIGADAVDLGRFRVLVGAARTARRYGDHERVCLLLEEALRLWRSPLLADLPALTAQPPVRAIEGERAMAVCWYAEAALRQGAADEALVTVDQAAAVSPLDESLHAWLIRLCLAVGRRAEGLAAYRRIERRLARDLGVDPRPELEQLRRALVAAG